MIWFLSMHFGIGFRGVRWHENDKIAENSKATTPNRCVKVSLLFSKLLVRANRYAAKAMTASSHTESAGKFEGSRANVMEGPCFLPCACTDMLFFFRIVFSDNVVFVFLAVLFSSFLRTFTDVHTDLLT